MAGVYELELMPELLEMPPLDAMPDSPTELPKPCIRPCIVANHVCTTKTASVWECQNCRPLTECQCYLELMQMSQLGNPELAAALCHKRTLSIGLTNHP